MWKVRLSLLAILTMIGMILTVQEAAAGQYPHERKGVVAGLEIGHGGSQVEYLRNNQNFTSEEESGCALGLRVGYGFTNSFTLTLDGMGYCQDHHGEEYVMSSTVLMFTYYPDAGGFFLRAGFGGGRLESNRPEDDDDPLAVEFEENAGVLAFGLGYEWRLSKSLALGLAFDARGGVVEDFADLQDITLGHGSLGLHCNLYF
ncbi:MAG: hypothetical protein ABIF77_17975 [bacterium]